MGRMALEAQKTAAAPQQQLQNDVNSINQYNASLDQINDRVVPVLKDISGRDFGSDTVAWQKWLNNLVGFNSLQASEPPDGDRERSAGVSTPADSARHVHAPIGVQRMSCFGAGTMVRTLDGIGADRVAESGRPGSDPEHQDRCPGLQADPRRPPQPAQQDF